ncbi:MAG: hypothetical protein GTO40_00740 [Deltaproteobacteria bacterium]|nr:hypothetical protein [Deltaproteobacteria bacterium]
MPTVSPEWLKSHLDAHERYGGLLAVGGSICFDTDAPFWARCDHYCSWYNVTSGRPSAWVPNHPAANLSIARSTFERVGPFREDLPRSGVHEETEWEGRLQRLGGRIRFEPHAAIWHTDRGDLRSYLKHNYRWGYNSIGVKSKTAVSRFPWVYRRPKALMVGFLPFAVAHTIYTVGCWLRVGKLEPLLLSPFLFLGRFAYAGGMVMGGLRAKRSRSKCNRRS